ncbi:uncharacterized protein B0T23DRAFT_378292 [Neurospora hispaniola]|uniref:Uncharacterized protein n=1 Tax=Neurospora hispaniola TaxID=588809 RepID=A0AAJ0MSV2_9PEZI|nr:hypothetical protein B0T23DRAFT_378292 [Neurospora hispaniola]
MSHEKENQVRTRNYQTSLFLFPKSHILYTYLLFMASTRPPSLDALRSILTAKPPKDLSPTVWDQNTIDDVDCRPKLFIFSFSFLGLFFFYAC